MSPPNAALDLYLALLKKCLTRTDFGNEFHMIDPARGTLVERIYRPVRWALSTRNLRIVQEAATEQRVSGDYWPVSAETMVGLKRLDNVQECVAAVLEDGIPGDLIETGVWRGGSTILMRAVLAAYDDAERCVWVADSFQGLPEPNVALYPEDAKDTHHSWSQLAVSVDQVKTNFARYGLLDDRVRFLSGWFKDSLPDAPIERLAVLRIDGDMYESTIDPLRYLYPKLSPGGFVIIDDYANPKLRGCKQAVDDYRAEHAITDDITQIDWTGVFWRKSTD